MSLDETRIGVTIQKIALFQVSELIYPYIYILYVYIYIYIIRIYIYVELIFSIGAWWPILISAWWTILISPGISSTCIEWSFEVMMILFHHES